MRPQVEGEFEYHTECTACGSSDGKAVYSSGTGYCFVCNAFSSNEEGIIKVNKKDNNFTPQQTTQIAKRIRGISSSIFSKYSYYLDDNDLDVHVINHRDTEGNIVAQKLRYPDKTFKWKGNAKAAVPFGMNLWRSGGKRITITEGELDCLSIAEALDGKYPVISINNGANSAKKELTPHLEYINSFDEIVLWFDSDAPGRKAVQEVSSLFPPGKVYVCQAGNYKDANDVLNNKSKAGVLSVYYENKLYTPSGIVNANEGGFDSFMEDSESDEVYDTQYTNLNIAKGAITTFVSGSGMGKSTIVREIGHNLMMKHNLTIGHVALEENNSVSKRAYIGIELNEQLVKKTTWHDYKTNPKNTEKLKEAYDNVIGNNRLYLYNHFGSLDSDSLLSKLRYLAVGASCDVIILDHISIVVSGLDDMGDNERRVIDVLMTKLRSLVEETGVGMILVSHLKRLPGAKGHEDGEKTSLSHLRGSGSIAQLSDMVIGIEGNQQDKENSNRRVVRCLKDREGGETGILGGAIYIKEEGRLLPADIEEEGFTDEQPQF